MNEIKLRANLPISLDITTRFLAFFVEKISRRVNLQVQNKTILLKNSAFGISNLIFFRGPVVLS